MKNQCEIMKAIEFFGEKYSTDKRHLGRWNRIELEQNWWTSLKFFFERSFLRGRTDTLSLRYYEFTIEVLGNFFQADSISAENSLNLLRKCKANYGRNLIVDFKSVKYTSGNRRKNSIKHKDFKKDVLSKNPLIEKLTNPLKQDQKLALNNDKDLMMVLDVLKFISQDGRESIYTYLKNGLFINGAEKVHAEMKDEIFGIAHKVAAFIIRDIGLLNPGAVKTGFEWAFPVDTWVSQVARKYLNRDLKEINSRKDVERLELFIREALACKNSIDPLKLAAGMWYVGFYKEQII